MLLHEADIPPILPSSEGRQCHFPSPRLPPSAVNAASSSLAHGLSPGPFILYPCFYLGTFSHLSSTQLNQPPELKIPKPSQSPSTPNCKIKPKLPFYLTVLFFLLIPPMLQLGQNACPMTDVARSSLSALAQAPSCAPAQFLLRYSLGACGATESLSPSLDYGRLETGIQYLLASTTKYPA